MAKRLSGGFKITIGIIIVIVCFILLVMVIGAIADATSRGRLAEIKDNSLAFLKSHIREDEGNALEFFSDAAKSASDVTASFFPYLDGESEISPALMKAILDNLDGIALIEQGAQMEFYCFPYEYEKGAAAELPEYFNLSKAVRLTCAKALFDLEQGRTDHSLDDLLHVIRAGELIASETPVIIDVAIGNGYARQSLDILHLGLAAGAYDGKQRDMIEGSLKRFEEEWPLVGLSLEGEVCGMAIIFFDALRYPGAMLQMGQMLTNSFGDVFRLFLFRLMCWRFWFSPSRMYLSGHASISEVVEEFKVLERMELSPANLMARKEKEDEFREHLQQALDRNLLLNLTFPNIMAISSTRLKTLTWLHAARLCCAVRAFQQDNRRFPVNLQEVGNDIIYDFNTGKVWEYKNNGDTATISSPGPDKEQTTDDISITLTNLGITEYLKRLRAIPPTK